LQLEKSNWKKVFFAGWLTQFILTLIGFNWVTFTAHEFGHLPWPVAGAVLVAFCSFANLDVPLAGLAWFFCQKKWQFPRGASLLLLALWTALFESFFPTLFPWNYAYTWFWVKAPLAQLGEILGFQGLSSIIIMLNLGALWWWLKRKNPRPLALTVGLFLLMNLAGWGLQKTLPTPDKTASVLLTQANIGNLEKQYAEKGWGFREHIFGRYAELSKSARLARPDKNVDFMVWPETAYPFDMDQRLWSHMDPSQTITDSVGLPPAAQRLLTLAKDLNTNLITGGYGYSPKDDKVTNTFFIAHKNGYMSPNPYYKSILLAFGEYIPLGDTFPKLKNIIPAGDFSRGPGPQVQKLDDFILGPQICYESLFPYFTRELANQDAQLIVNLTNDSWYGTWQEPYQHLYMTLARAIEFRRPLIRATNTGISTVALASGEVLEKSPLAREWTYIYDVPYLSRPQTTFYQICPWLLDGFLIITILLIIGKAFVGKSKKSRLV
jgi:apolipoprotein N-acyltransferase